MTVVSVDSSGHVKNPPIWVVAVRKRSNGQEHSGIYVSKDEHDRYVDSSDAWAEKLSAAMIYVSVKPILHAKDTLTIDTDFQGNRKERVRKYLYDIFGKKHYGTALSQPQIDFAPAKSNKYVKIADIKSKRARSKNLEIGRNRADLQKIMGMLK